MKQPSISLNVDYICDMARDSGADDATLAQLRAKLEARNGANNPAFELAEGKIAKAMRLLGRNPLTGADTTKDATSPAQLLLHASDLQTRILLGQWENVARMLLELRHLTELAGPGAVICTKSEFEQWQRQLAQLASVAADVEKRGDRHGGVSTRLFFSSRMAYSAVCVLTCQHDDCALRHCGETLCRFRGGES